VLGRVARSTLEPAPRLKLSGSKTLKTTCFNIFADLDDRDEGTGERFVQKLPNSLLIPVAALLFLA
jgi:hypothetical protein